MLKLKLDIMKDEAYNPREEEENIGTLCAWHAQWRYGDNDNSLTPRQYLMHLIPGKAVYDPSNMTMEQLEEEVKKHYLFLPVYGYDHGGMSISTSPYGDKWDSGRLGFIYCEKDKSQPSDDEARLDRLRVEVERYNYYLQDIAFCATTEIYSGDKLLIEIRSGTLLGFPELYRLDEIVPTKGIHAFEEDFDKNKTSWLPPITKWAKLKNHKKIAQHELKESAKDVKEINKEDEARYTVRNNCLFAEAYNIYYCKSCGMRHRIFFSYAEAGNHIFAKRYNCPSCGCHRLTRENDSTILVRKEDTMEDSDYYSFNGTSIIKVRDYNKKMMEARECLRT